MYIVEGRAIAQCKVKVFTLHTAKPRLIPTTTYDPKHHHD